MTKSTLIVLMAIVIHARSFAQQKDFEGKIFYKIDVKSKVEGVADKIWRNTLAMGDSLVAFISKGNYRQITGKRDTYLINKDQKIYYRFKGIDTLFYYDYTADSSIVSDISKQDEKKNIAGFECNSITIKTSSSTKKYYYSPTLYMNPEYDKNNKVGRYDVFAKETSSLYLAEQEETDSYSFL